MPLMLFLLLVAVVLNVVDGKAGIAGFFEGGRAETWIATLVVLAGALVIAGFAVRQRWDGIFIDRENHISLSRFQLVLWTLLLVSALMTAGLINSMPPADKTPLEIDIPPQIWALLGLGAFTAVAAPAIKESKRSAVGGADVTHTTNTDVPSVLFARQNLTARPTYDGRVLVKADAKDARWIDLIYGEYEGAAHVDISKLQQLAFTLLLISIYATALWGKMLGTVDIDKFPEVDGGFVALLGLSHAAYLADKQIGST